MIVDELILKLRDQLDEAHLKASLNKFEKAAEQSGKEAGAKMGKEMGTSFADVFQAIAGAAILNSVKSFYARAAQEFNKFEAAFLRVDSIAKGFGRSVDVARKQVEQLADKGFLNLNQAASSYADAIALGFDEKQARKFIDSLSDIAAFQNTIGDGAAAVQSGLAGLLSNSAEKVENIGVPVKVLNMAYNENIKTMGKAAALQKFYNGILKESEKFQGDAARAVDTLAGAQNKANAATDKAMVAIGKGLEPTLKRFYNLLEDGAKWFAKWFEGMDSGTKTILIFIPILSALTVALGALVPVLKALSLANPFGWIAAAIALFGGLIAISNEFINKSKPENLVKSYKETQKEMESLGAKTQALQSMNKRTIEQEQELIKSKQKLREEAQALGLDYDALTAKLKDFNKVAEEVTKARRDQTAKEIDKTRATNAENLRDLDERIARTKKFYERQGIKFDATSNLPTIDPSGLQNPSSPIGAILRAREATANKSSADDLARASLFADESQAGKKAASELAAGKATETRFIESQAKLLEIEKNRLFTIRNISKKISEEEQQRQRDNANQDANYQRESVRSSLRQTFAEYIEDKRAADLLALSESTNNAKRASKEQLTYELNLAGKNEGLIQQAKENNAKRLAKINEANARKQTQIDADAAARTLQAASAVATGLQQVGTGTTSGQKLGGVGSALTGASALKDIMPGVSVLGPIGLGLGAVAGIGTVIEGLWGKSDEERRKEAAEQAQRDEEARKILELQANYQKSMLALQEAAAKLPFENLQRQLRLIDIEAQKSQLSGVDSATIEANKLNAKNDALTGTLQSESGAIGQGRLFGGTGATPDELISFLSDRAAQSVAVGQFMQLVDLVASGTLSPGQYEEVKRQAQTYKGKIPDTLFNAAFNRWGDFAYGGVKSVREGGVETVTIQGNQALTSDVRSLVSEIGVDTGTAENLLSVIEQQLAINNQIQDNTKKTAENTAKALELRPDRERSFIDVGQGFIQSLGQRITAPSAIGIARSVSQNLTLPSELGAATVISGRARTLQERMADALEIQIRQGATANDLLRQLLGATLELQSILDNDSTTSPTNADQLITDFLSRSARRRY